MNRLSIVSLCIAAMFGGQASAQEIILLNQDGEKVGVARDVDEAKVVPEKPVAVEEEDVEAATLENGVIKIVSADGAVQEFNLADARSVTITRSSNTVVGDDGQPRIETRAKAILIGPDGVRREIDLDESGKSGTLVREDKLPKSWMIGVTCEALSPILRSQLQLEQDTGLAVRRALGGGTAEAAGIQANDVILYADQKPIATQKQLTEVVNEAGAADRNLSMTVLRAGEEMSFTVTPSERDGFAPRVGGGFEGFGLRNFDLPNFGPADGLEFRQFGPGVIIGGDLGGFGAGGLHKEMMEKMQQRMQRMQEQVEDMHREMRGQIETP